MPVLTLGYRHCDRKRPSYIKNSEIEGIAVLARQPLVDAAADAISLATVSAISGLKINGVVFDLFVGTGDVVHDERGNPVLGICEYDPGVSDTAMVSVSPVGVNASEELVLSTLGHELGHAIFDAPGWIVDASKASRLPRSSPRSRCDPVNRTMARKSCRAWSTSSPWCAKPSVPASPCFWSSVPAPRRCRKWRR
jgi:hypothetical protein